MKLRPRLQKSGKNYNGTEDVRFLNDEETQNSCAIIFFLAVYLCILISVQARITPWCNIARDEQSICTRIDTYANYVPNSTTLPASTLRIHATRLS